MIENVQKNAKKTIFIVGETACGKSDYAVDFALDIGAEIVSADSRQVYKGLDIGSGKITIKEMKGVPHHLLDVALPGERYTLFDYQRQAEAAIADINDRGKTAIICGGSGLYIDALLAGYRLVEHSDYKNQLVDAKAAKLHLPKNVIRSLNKSEANNPQHLSALAARGGKNLDPRWPDRNRPESKVIHLRRGRQQLRQRINDRVDDRIANGMIDEVRNLLDAGVSTEWLIGLGLEYRYLTRYIIGELDLDQSINGLKTSTWRFTARQRNWIKRWRAQIIDI